METASRYTSDSGAPTTQNPPATDENGGRRSDRRRLGDDFSVQSGAATLALAQAAPLWPSISSTAAT